MSRPAHLADLVVIALGILSWFICIAVNVGPFDGQIISGWAQSLLALILAAAAAVALHLAVKLERPRWVWPLVVASSFFGFHELVRVINALDRSEPIERRTHVAQWHSKYVSWRGSGKWVQGKKVVLASWKAPSEQLEFRVPEGAVSWEIHFTQKRLVRLREEWEAPELRKMKEYEEKHFGELANLNPGRERVLPPFPQATMGELMFPEGVPCDVLIRPGLLGLEHLVGLRLLNSPEGLQSARSVGGGPCARRRAHREQASSTRRSSPVVPPSLSASRGSWSALSLMVEHP